MLSSSYMGNLQNEEASLQGTLMNHSAIVSALAPIASAILSLNAHSALITPSCKPPHYYSTLKPPPSH